MWVQRSRLKNKIIDCEIKLCFCTIQTLVGAAWIWKKIVQCVTDTILVGHRAVKEYNVQGYRYVGTVMCRDVP